MSLSLIGNKQQRLTTSFRNQFSFGARCLRKIFRFFFSVYQNSLFVVSLPFEMFTFVFAHSKSNVKRHRAPSKLSFAICFLPTSTFLFRYRVVGCTFASLSFDWHWEFRKRHLYRISFSILFPFISFSFHRFLFTLVTFANFQFIFKPYDFHERDCLCSLHKLNNDVVDDVIEKNVSPLKTLLMLLLLLIAWSSGVSVQTHEQNQDKSKQLILNFDCCRFGFCFHCRQESHDITTTLSRSHCFASNEEKSIECSPDAIKCKADIYSSSVAIHFATNNKTVTSINSRSCRCTMCVRVGSCCDDWPNLVWFKHVFHWKILHKNSFPVRQMIRQFSSARTIRRSIDSKIAETSKKRLLHVS